VRFRERAVSGDTCLGWCFDVSVAEASCYDGVHATELAAWLVRRVVGFGRIVASEIEAPILFVNRV
jgi:hypothetical protein